MMKISLSSFIFIFFISLFIYVYIYLFLGWGGLQGYSLYFCVGELPPKSNYRNGGDSPSLQRTVMSFHFNDKKNLKLERNQHLNESKN